MAQNQNAHDEPPIEIEELEAPVQELTEADAACVGGGQKVEIGALKAGASEVLMVGNPSGSRRPG